MALISTAAARDDQAARAQNPPSPNLEVDIEEGLLTLRADGAPLVEVLRAVGEAGGFEVVLRGVFAAPVRDSFADRPLKDAVRRLVAGHSVVMVHEGLDPASGGAAAVAKIRVIEDPAGAAARAVGTAEDARPAAERGSEVDPAATMGRESARPSTQGLPAPRREERGERILAQVLATEPDATVRSRAMAALTRLDAPGARQLLRERALGDHDARLRMLAVNALAASAGERSVQVLGQALRRDAEPKVRMSAVRALQRVGGERAQRHLERAIRDPDPQVSLAAEQALATWPRRAE